MIHLEKPCCTVVAHAGHIIELPTAAGVWPAECPGWYWAPTVS